MKDVKFNGRESKRVKASGKEIDEREKKLSTA